MFKNILIANVAMSAVTIIEVASLFVYSNVLVLSNDMYCWNRTVDGNRGGSGLARCPSGNMDIRKPHKSSE